MPDAATSLDSHAGLMFHSADFISLRTHSQNDSEGTDACCNTRAEVGLTTANPQPSCSGKRLLSSPSGHSLSLRKRVLSAYLTSTHLIVLQEILLLFVFLFPFILFSF